MNEFVSRELYKQRIKTCQSCPEYQPKFNRCKKCGCFLLVKAAITVTECPLKKW